MKNSFKETVPVFFAADENYMPFLAVTLNSLKKRIAKDRLYKVHVLYSGKLGKNAGLIRDMQTENLRVEFNDITARMQGIMRLTHCRDYYTSAIYFRLFIPELFPQYKKAIYLDCDTVLLEDIGKLYDIPLGSNYIGAVADPVVAAFPPFVAYTKNALNIDAKRYFNSGVIVMNLDALRAIDFYDVFCRVLGSYDFVVAPDQDCLNIICKGKVHYFGMAWNTMPLGDRRARTPKLIHYNLSMKPWHYDNVLYEDIFWAEAKETPFYEFIQEKKNSFTPEMAKRDEDGGAKLMELAQAEADNPNNYFRTVGKNFQIQEKTEDGYGFIERFGEKTGTAFSD